MRKNEEKCKDGKDFTVKSQEEWNNVLRQMYRNRYGYEKI